MSREFIRGRFGVGAFPFLGEDRKGDAGTGPAVVVDAIAIWELECGKTSRLNVYECPVEKLYYR